MRKSLCNGKAVFNFLSSKTLSCVKNTSKYFVSTQTNQSVSSNIKFEKERKSVFGDALPNIMLSRPVKTTEDWRNVREEIFKMGRQITAVNIDSTIMSFCMSRQNYSLAYSYIEFLKQENIKPNLATVGKYFKLFYLTNCDKIVKKEDESSILQLYKQLRKTYTFLDASTCENLIHALSITNDWKECLKLLEEIKISCDPSTAAYSVTVAAAFKSNEYDLAWNLLNDIIDKNRNPCSIAYLSFLEQSEKCGATEDVLTHLEKLFEFFRVHNIVCDVEVAEKVDNLHKKFKLSSKTTTVDNMGICQNCKQKLQKLELHQKEFEKLKNAIFKNVIIGENVFYKTTPEELGRFQSFISNMKRYDVVVDGLNVAYSVGTKQSSYILSSLVAAVVRHFVNQNKQVLVLGRTHMKKWPTKNWSFVTQNADTFLAHSLSQDDPYLLYCALNCGLNTIVVSRDLMRSHLFKLKDPQLKILFTQWLTQSQYQLQYVSNQGKVFFKYPLPYVRTAQKHQDSWHIPIDDEADDATKNKWLCLRA